MKIAHISLYPPKRAKHVGGGSGVTGYTKNLVTNIGGAEQYVLCQRLGGKTDSYQEDDIEVRRCFDRSNSFAWQLHRELKKIRPDAVHIQQELALYGGITTAWLLQFLVLAWRRKVIITLHGVVDPREITPDFVRQNNSRLPVWAVRLAFRVIYEPLVRWSRHIIVHEVKFKNILMSGYGAGPDKISVIPHGVEDLQTIPAAEARRKLDLPQDANIALFMGYATGYKGIDLLLEGFAGYCKTDPAAFLILGAGEHPKLKDTAAYKAEYKRLQNKAAALIPAGQYRWAGFINENQLTDYYSAADVSVYPYTVAMSSSGPMSFAIGYEKPFLASAAFGAIFRSQPLLLFDQTPAGLAARLDYFFKNQNKYINISANFKQQRKWSSVGEQTAQIYQTIAKTSMRKGPSFAQNDASVENEEEYAEEGSVTG